MANRGMMAESMFASKATLLNWLNTHMQLRLEKVEDTCSGALACQLMDCLHPGSVNMKKVDFNVKNAYEFEKNYKELQQAFDKAGLSKAFNPDGLAKGKFQDNNEFMQWFKGYWDEITGGQEITDYDPIGRRQASKSGDWKKFSLGELGARPARGDTIPAVRRGGALPPRVVGSSAGATKAAVSRALSGSGGVASKASSAAPSRTSSLGANDSEHFHQQIAELTEQMTELKLKVETVERERDFYFDKLRDIEVLTQAPELAAIPIVKIVERILYAADSAEAKEAMTEAAAQYGATFEQAVEEDSAAVHAVEAQ